MNFELCGWCLIGIDSASFQCCLSKSRMGEGFETWVSDVNHVMLSGLSACLNTPTHPPAFLTELIISSQAFTSSASFQLP